MKFTCSAEALQHGIGAVQNAVGTKISNPIVENIKLEAEESALTFLGTNLSLHIRCQVEADVAKAGAVALPTDYLVSTFRELTAGPVEVDQQGQDVTFKTQSGEVKLRSIPCEEFPEFDTGIEGATIMLPIPAFKGMCRKTLFATSPEKARFELDGVKFVLDQGTLTCVATDGRRLSRVVEKLEGVDTGLSVAALIPAKTLNELSRIIPLDGSLTMVLGKSKAYFEAGDVALVSTLLEDKFPPYEQIIPKSFEVTFEVVREPFLHGVRMVSALANAQTRMVKLSLGEGRMVLQGEQEQVGNSREEVEVPYTGDPLTVGYKASYLLDALRALDDEKVELNLINPTSPGVLRGGRERGFTHVIMPMQISDEA